MKKIAIIGASGHGKVVADIAKLNSYDEIVFLDDDENIKACGQYRCIGKSADAIMLSDQGYDTFVAIGNAKIRQRIQGTLAEKNSLVTLIHPAAVIASDTEIGLGTVIMAGTVVNSGTVIGDGCIVNTGATVDHDNKLGNFSHVSVGSHLAGTVEIGARTWIGAGAVVSNNITITDDTMVGAGTVVIRNITEAGTYVGNPARKIK